MALPIRSQDLFIEFVANLKSQLEVSVGDERVSCHFLSFGVPISHMRLNARKGWMRGSLPRPRHCQGLRRGPGGTRRQGWSHQAGLLCARAPSRGAGQGPVLPSSGAWHRARRGLGLPRS